MSDPRPWPAPPPERPDRAKVLKRALPSEAPDLVPARMINELFYCERLLYLEWAQSEFQDNVFTVDGRVVHRRVDGGSGSLPAPDEDDDKEEPPPFTARSVWLSSERLGLTAKIDLVEGEDGEVVPVEYKRGHAPEVKGGAYLPERAQVCAHVLLLREHGHRCERGEIWFAADRRRVPIEIDDWLINETLSAVRRAREITSAGIIPSPLEDSPKCKGCSLAPVCLPDEVTLLRGLRGEPMNRDVDEPPQLTFAFAIDVAGPMQADPWGLGGEIAREPEPAREIRRLVPPRDVGMPLYVQSPGARVALDGERLRVELGSGQRPTDARLAHTSHVALFGNVQLTTQAIGALLDRDIPVAFFSGGGWFRGRTVGHVSKNIELRVAQHRAAADAAVACELACTFVAAKIRNQRTLLRRNHAAPDPVVLGELEAMAKKAERAESVASLLGLEGTAARYYFGAFTGMLKGSAAEAFDLEGRNRRPPRDPINAVKFPPFRGQSDYAAAAAT
ncbi:MAG: CRISPR-associated endonuclease Cas1 [Myxococcota bacterium]|nr:CRISPR-associated endonuclease Cas1 [Myxococcota bacterium]